MGSSTRTQGKSSECRTEARLSTTTATEKLRGAGSTGKKKVIHSSILSPHKYPLGHRPGKAKKMKKIILTYKRYSNPCSEQL
jgi:hypothetical protein